MTANFLLQNFHKNVVKLAFCSRICLKLPTVFIRQKQFAKEKAERSDIKKRKAKLPPSKMSLKLNPEIYPIFTTRERN